MVCGNSTTLKAVYARMRSHHTQNVTFIDKDAINKKGFEEIARDFDPIPAPLFCLVQVTTLWLSLASREKTLLHFQRESSIGTQRGLCFTTIRTEKPSVCIYLSRDIINEECVSTYRKGSV